MIAELHCHSNYSDGLHSIKTIVNYASSFLDIIAITDHHNINCTKYKTNKIILLPGCEFYTNYGHLLVYGLEEMPRKNENLFDFAKERELPIVQAHPFRKSSICNKVKIIEAINGRSFDYINKKALKYARKMKMKITAGSDAHFLREIGKCHCVINADTKDDIITEILKGRVKVHYVKTNYFDIIFNTITSKILKTIL